MRIKAGDLVVHERPALVGRLGAPPERRAFRALDPEEQRDVMALCDAYAEGPGGKTLEGIMATNGLPRGPKAEEVVLCPLASRFNHSCSPNAEYLWSEAGYVEEVAGATPHLLTLLVFMSGWGSGLVDLYSERSRW